MKEEMDVGRELDRFRADFELLRKEMGQVIAGQDHVIQEVLTACVVGGHVLLEGVPGLGKTLLVRTLAETLDAKFSRIQFTPDLMPADLTGTNIVTTAEDGRRQFEFQQGPLFGNIILADEINRATPKTQSALLEAMAEHAITTGGKTHRLDGLFFVLATQNPLEMDGTWPLPEAQLDRFFCKVLVPFPGTAELLEILNRTTGTDEHRAEQVLSGERILEMGRLARTIPVAEEVAAYAVDLICRTHPTSAGAPVSIRKYVRYGASPRGAQSLLLAGKVRAILDHRCHVSRSDLNEAAPAVLRHRLILNFEGQADQVSVDRLIAELTHV